MDIDDGYFWLSGGWIVYLFLHSFLASFSMKNVIERWSIGARLYRIIYNVISGVGLFVLLLLNASIDSERIVGKFSALNTVALVLGAAGIVVIRQAFKQYSLSAFAGFKSEEASELSKNGILKYVRHPIYSGTILVLFGFLLYDLRWPTLISVLCIMIYLPIGIWFEEKKLIRVFGQGYLDYKKETPALIPKLF